MNQRHPRRDQARAIAISAASQAKTTALLVRSLMTATAVALTLEAVIVAHGYLVGSHP